MFNRDFAFNPARDVPNILFWWDPSTAPKIIGGPDNADGYSRLVSKVTRNDGVPKTGVLYMPVPTTSTTAGRTYAGPGTYAIGILGMTNALSMAAMGLTAATIMVAAPRSGNNDSRAYYNRFGGAADDTYHAFADGNCYDDFGSTVRQVFSHATSFTGDHVICTRARTGQWDFWVDGVNQYSTTTNTFSFAGAVAGGIQIPKQNTLDGYYEVMVVGRYITDTEMWQLYRYMAAKWKIPLTAGPRQFRSDSRFRRRIFPVAAAATYRPRVIRWQA